MLMPIVATAKPKVNVRWCTFNIRYNNPDDVKAGFGWEERKQRVAQYILDNDIDIVGEYINILGGTYLVDALSFDTVYSKTKEVIKKASSVKKAQ